LQNLVLNNLLPSIVLLLGESEIKPLVKKARENSRSQLSTEQKFSTDIPVLTLIQKYNLPYKLLNTNNPNSEEVIKIVKALNQEIIIYSGPGGVILSNSILSAGKKFLHVHPGIVPEFRGSTTVYYSLLEQKKLGATAFFMSQEIDCGDVIKTQVYEPPNDRTLLDVYFDPFIRSQLLVDVLQELEIKGVLSSESQRNDSGETYFIIHPVLKHIAILGS
jgi:methionyl-tRNA formyltransferase